MPEILGLTSGLRRVHGGASVPRSLRWYQPQARVKSAGFSFGFGGLGDLLAPPFRPLLSRCDRFHPQGKPSSRPPFAPSLKVQRDDTHNNSGFLVI